MAWKRTTITFVNCSNFELGSLEVVITILGSCTPAREYSLSICDVGSGRLGVENRDEVERLNTDLLVPRQKSSLSLVPPPVFWVLGVTVSPSQEHLLVVASAHMFAFPELLVISHRHIAVFLEFAGEATFVWAFRAKTGKDVLAILRKNGLNVTVTETLYNTSTVY